MIKHLRDNYNKNWTEEKYKEYTHYLNNYFDFPIDFRLSETPVFFPKEFKAELREAVKDILDFLKSDKFKEISKKAIPPGLEVPNEDAHTNLLAIDFAVCKDADGKLIPQLIELQGFASLYCYQEMLSLAFRKHFDIPDTVTHFFSGLEHNSYIEVLKKTFLGDCKPENVILLEIEPEKQKTRVDFAATEKWIGIRAVCLTKITKEGKQLFYDRDGKKTRIERIYNRVIYDELKNRPDLKYNFKISEDLDVQWVAHPNWFFKISKYLLPYIKSKYAPDSRFVSEIETFPTDLENYVLKPLFSFAGVGVKFDLTKEDLEAIPESEKANFVLQKKIEYTPVVETLDEPAKAEIRILCVWNGDEEPMPVINLIRMSKGKMMGVDFNKGKTWTGSSVGYFEKD
ncbi:hypothetical protein BH10BAC5_BH10BAC5_13620 [soil metagenome]